MCLTDKQISLGRGTRFHLWLLFLLAFFPYSVSSAKVKAPLNGRVCGRACLGPYDPALVLETPIGLIKKDSTSEVRSRVDDAVRGIDGPVTALKTGGALRQP